MTPEELEAKIKALEGERDKLAENNTRLADQLKARPPVEEVLALLKGDKDKPDDDRVPASFVDSVIALRAQASDAEKASAKAAADLKAEAKARAEAEAKHLALQQKVDFGDLRSQLVKAGGARLQPKMVDRLTAEVLPLVAKGEDGNFAPSKDGKPWMHGGKALGLADLLDDMSPTGKHEITGLDVPGYFTVDHGKFPGDAGGGGGGGGTAAPGSLEAARQQLRADLAGA